MVTPMENEEIIPLNACTDLVALKRNEAFPFHLLSDHRAGEWVNVRDLCRQAGVNGAEVRPNLFAAWLADPLGNAGYAVVLFYDDLSKWSLTAHYNKQRSIETAGQNRVESSVQVGQSADSISAPRTNVTHA
jgi:hypothetical protein